MIPFDGQLFRRFWRIAGPYWFSDGRRGALGLLALLVALLFGQALFAVLLNAQTGEFTSALAAHDEARFWSSIRQCLVLLVVAVPTHAFYYYVRDTLGLRWRRWLTGDYLSGRKKIEVPKKRRQADPEQLIGLITLSDQADNNRGFWLDPAWQRQGLMTEACRCVTDFWFNTLHREVLRAPKARDNDGSRKISMNSGMRLIRVEKQQFTAGMLDAELWEITREEWNRLVR